MFLKFRAQAFQAGDFLNISLKFLVFEAHFHIKLFLIKNVYCMKYHPEKVLNMDLMCPIVIKQPKRKIKNNVTSLVLFKSQKWFSRGRDFS